ncbi:MAG: hypothetical protein HY748_04750 [Elusimicrobia bacterium]|nr:hypothetical protein [Elusimicrobiota bacterium]
MIEHEDSVTLFAAPERVWAVIIDVPRWWRLYYAPMAKWDDYGWSEELKFLGGQAGGMRWGALRDGVVMQALRVEEWSPPLRLVLATEAWNPERASPSSMKADLGKGRFREFVTNINAVRARFFLDLAPMPPAQTRLTIREEAEALNPLLDLLLRIPGKSALRKCADSFIRGFPELL